MYSENSLLTIIKEDWIAHGRDWTRPGFRAVAAHRLGTWRMRITNTIIRSPFSVLYRFLYRRARNVYGIELPYSVKLGRRVIIEHQSGITIHGLCEIGDDCIIRQGVTLGLKTLDAPNDVPILGKGVEIGAGAVVLGKVTIGDKAKIGANSVVLHDVAPGNKVGGIPAKPI